MSESTPSVEEAGSPKPVMSAREKAEARRRRILESSQDRMNVVSGAPATTPPAEVVDADADADADVDASPEDAAAEVKTEDSNTDPSPAKPASSSSSARRLAQMRRMKYKKAADDAAKEESKAEGATEENSADGEVEAEESKAEVLQGQVQAPAPVLFEDEKNEEEKTGTAGAKKYMGVAKMRRKMLAEKKQSQEAADSNEMKELETKLPKSMKPKSVDLAPIFIQLFTVLFLFFAGFDVGIQNHAIMKQEVPYVHTNLSYVDHGIGLLSLFGEKSTSANQDNLMVLNDVVELDITEEDEFGDAKTKPAGATSDANQEDNFDPLFAFLGVDVDFDKVMAGDGMIMGAARFAVSIHRSMMYFFYTFFYALPLAFIHKLLSIPKSLFANPPVLFLCAIIIRYIGKHILGGTIPKLDEMIEAEVKADNEKKEKDLASKMDFVSMGTNFASNFATNNFPKVVMAYTIFKDARSDMFVVLCGFFVGLIAPVSIMGSTIASEEL